MVTLSEWDLATKRPKLVENSLASRFEKQPVTLIDEQLFTPGVMMSLLETGASRFEKPWAGISPLYIQSPNITQRKAKPGTFK